MIKFKNKIIKNKENPLHLNPGLFRQEVKSPLPEIAVRVFGSERRIQIKQRCQEGRREKAIRQSN